MRLKSVKTQYALAAAGLFGFAFLASSILSIQVVRNSNLDAQEVQLANASKQAGEALSALNARIASYARIILAKPDIATAISSGDRGKLESMAVGELKTLKAADPVVSTFEVTDAKGIVIIRGHNPKTFGDDKSKLSEVAGALAGRTTLGLTVSPTSGQAALDVLAPVMADGKVVGTLKMGAYATTSLVQEVKDKTGAEVLTIFKGKVTASTFPKETAINLQPERLQGAVTGTPQMVDVEVSGTAYRAEFRHVPSLAGEGLVIGTFVASAPFLAKTTEFVQKMTLAGLVALPVALVIGFIFGHLVGRPLVDAAGALTALAKGENARLTKHEKSGTEIGDMARAFADLRSEVLNSFKLRQALADMPIGVMTIDRENDWRIDYINPTLHQLLGDCGKAGIAVGGKASEALAVARIDNQMLEALPNGGRRVRVILDERVFALTICGIHAPAGGQIGAMVAWEDVSEKNILATQFESTIKGVVDSAKRMSADLRKHAQTVRGSAAATLAQAEAVARSSEENSASVTTVASAAEELSASVNDVASQIGQSSQKTREAADQSIAMVGVVHELQEAATRIGTVVQLIGSIASQTNLLALNATIEAARAGEAGRGFAVVAGEVKALATQTAKAAEDVVTQVASIQAKTGEAVETIDRISTIISTVPELSFRVAQAVEQQRQATGEIARNTQQTASGTHEVAQSITEVSSATLETESASQSMLQQADDLRHMIDELDRDVDTFLATLAA
ncbi:MAG: methyl-accepting chemotaxis protein [Microcystis sp. LE19-4.1E]|jgi:methyl-accepting chemotaxis protein|nr:methyl-accepting chemotaxis protein [Microcystis sp. LE19-4.1E]